MMVVPLLLVLFVCGLVLWYILRAYQYWTRFKIPSLVPQLPYGNYVNYNRLDAVRLREIYRSMRQKGNDHVGIYFMFHPIYVPVSLEHVKMVMTTNFQHFTHRGVYYQGTIDPLSEHMFAAHEKKWRHLRTKLTPTFTSGKMRQMFDILIKCGEIMLEKLPHQAEIDIKVLFRGFTTDVIGSCAFGLDLNAIQDDESPFRFYGAKYFRFNAMRILVDAFTSTFPEFSRWLKLRKVPKDVAAFFHNVVRTTLEYRQANNVVRNDFLNLLMEMKDRDKSLTLDELAAQCFIFFLAGFETSSTAMTFIMYELASNDAIQTRLRHEINTVLNNGPLTYDNLKDMKYLDQVLDEGMRKYPPLPVLTRRCTRDFKIGPDLTVETGCSAFIPVLGIHYDPAYYPDPDRFDPERFSDEMKKTRNPYTHLPFGAGPRNCIGLRFGSMQAKLGIVMLIRQYRFRVSTRTKVPIEFSKETIVLESQQPIWLDAELIT